MGVFFYGRFIEINVIVWLWVVKLFGRVYIFYIELVFGVFREVIVFF